MANPRIIITAPYPQFTALAKQICGEQEIDAILIEAVLDDAAEQVERVLKNQDIEVIISRGGTVAAIKSRVDVPLIAAEAGDFDVLRALWQAKQRSGNIAFLGSAHITEGFDLDTVIGILGIKVKQYLYYDFQELQQKVAQACYDGAEVVVGGGQQGVKLAQAMGMQGVLVHSSRRTIVQAVLRAKHLTEIRQKDREYLPRMQSLISAVDDAMLLIDNQLNILVANQAVGKIFGTLELVNANLKSLTGGFFEKIFEDLSPCKAKVQVIGEARYAIDRLPIRGEKENLGTVVIIREVQRLQQLEQKIRKEIHHKGLVSKFTFEDIVGQSKVILDCMEMAKCFGKTESTILIYGESGTGKELFAQSIHQISSRKEGPFVAVNCAAIPENLLESELFGYEEGAFTGAKKGGKVGLFELAHGGTIFLDEIGKIPLSVQARLLRVLQEKEVMRVGGDRVIPIDIRIISATNRDLRHAVRDHTFREDLYFRLNILNLHLPPLRQRKDDLELLVEHFIARFNERFKKNVRAIPKELMHWIKNYNWPGNIRELENFLERMVILTDNFTLNSSFIQQLISYSNEELFEDRDCQDTVTVEVAPLKEMEKQIISILDRKLGHNRTHLAQLLGVSRTTLWKKFNE